MAALPSIFTTIGRTIKLACDAFVGLLPILLFLLALMFGAEYLIAMNTPTDPSQEGNAGLLVALPLIQSILEVICYVLILHGVYQKHHTKTMDYGQMFSVGLPRILPLIWSYIIVMLPIIAGGLIFGGLTYVLNLDLNAPNVVATTLMIVAGVALVIYSLLMLKVIVSPVYIVCKGMTGWAGLKESWRVMTGHWWKTFFLCLVLVLVLIVIAAVVIGISYMLNMPLLAGLLIIFWYPLGAAFLVIHQENLEIASKS